MPSYDSYQGEPLLTTEEAARYLNIPKSTLGVWRYANKGPTYLRFGTKIIRYRRSDLDAYITAQIVTVVE